MCYLFSLFFFFSSRRRHTRCLSDWSSDVCSSDVPELVAPERRQRAFSIFYTGGVGAGALSPVLYGMVSDLLSVPIMMALVAATVLTTLPLTWALRPALRDLPAHAG